MRTKPSRVNTGGAVAIRGGVPVSRFRAWSSVIRAVVAAENEVPTPRRLLRCLYAMPVLSLSALVSYI